jgi:steroid delta-isomerase-like uncharacterized protein
MSIESTREVMGRYWDESHSDMSMIAPDVVFTVMGTGQEFRGPDAVAGMLQYFYHVAFDAQPIVKSTVFGDNQAVLEADFVGKHIGDFGGKPATGKDVNVPLCVVYDLEGGQIKRGRIYFEADALRAQLGV